VFHNQFFTAQCGVVNHAARIALKYFHFNEYFKFFYISYQKTSNTTVYPSEKVAFLYDLALDTKRPDLKEKTQNIPCFCTFGLLSRLLVGTYAKLNYH
jgi:hypothetical protein